VTSKLHLPGFLRKKYIFSKFQLFWLINNLIQTDSPYAKKLKEMEEKYGYLYVENYKAIEGVPPPNTEMECMI
jgi:hypothetical protein